MAHKRFVSLPALALSFAIAFADLAFADTVITSEGPYSVAEADADQQSMEYGPGVVGVFATVEETASETGEADTSVVSESSDGDSTSAAATETSENISGTDVNIESDIELPELASEAAALYDATTGQFLFTKEGDKAMYPASTTKLMTALLTVEDLSLDTVVTYSASATEDLESGAVTVGLVDGDTLTVRDSLYALLLKSACEVANGLAEAVSGTQTEFVELMNARAAELGCTNTHFENPSGLNGASHYTTVKDMALIASAAISIDDLRTILQTRSYELPASKERSSLTITNGNKMLDTSSSYYYEEVIGGKTGYTSKAGNTLVEVADIDGHRLVAVVMKSNSQHYDDATKLLDYGKALIEAGVVTSASADPEVNTAVTSIDTDVNADPGETAEGFVETEEGVRYYKADGTYCQNEWLDLEDGKTYFFDGDGYMCTGWVHFANDSWYYFDTETGEMVSNKWVTQDGKSYYLGADGVMARDTIIDGTYRVNADGEYVEKVA